MEESKRENRIKKIIKLILLFFVFIILIGSAYAWYISNVSGNAEAKNVTLISDKLEITYEGGPELNVSNIVPGWTGTKTFTITNTGNHSETYKVAWQNITNNFINREDLIYSITSTNAGGSLSQTQIPNSAGHILIMDNITILPGVVQTYTLALQYLNTEYNQTSDKERTISGTLEVLNESETTIAAETTENQTPISSETETMAGMSKTALTEELRTYIKNEIYPIGSIYTSESSTNPSTLFGGTWQAYAAGKTLVGIDETDVDFDQITDNEGEKSHVLTVAEMPSHTHKYSYVKRSSFTTAGSNNGHYLHDGWETKDTGTAGEDVAHSNLQPYQIVYMWKRIT